MTLSVGYNAINITVLSNTKTAYFILYFSSQVSLIETQGAFFQIFDTFFRNV